MEARGPLDGVRVVELAGLGPCPMCGMLLAELGADVLRIERLGPSGLGFDLPPEADLLNRSRPAVAIDLKQDAGIDLVLALVERADALIEGFRPGVTERLGLGPEACARRNRRLVYGRVTGWGQGGPLAGTAGHDLGYIALTGALHAIGRAGQPPVPPLNLVGDFGGGALYLAVGVLAALVEARGSGQGQVVDAAMVDGAASLMTAAYALRAAGLADDRRGTNVLDGGAHFYDVYETRDGRHLAVAAIEPKFYAELLRRLGLDPKTLPQAPRQDWPARKAALAAVFRTRTRDEWMAAFEGSDACVAPVLDMDEAPRHPHNRARETFVRRAGRWQPNAAPRFSRTPTRIRSDPAPAGSEPPETLRAWGIGDGSGDRRVDVEALIAAGVVGARAPGQESAP
ncbi:MAG: CaiB/BaiF CoA-transferase family protein [Acidobacteria bacterium]|nr:CaiB/BaiF CoA-transferase family protein [Acidobacteriota bacterium]